MLPVQAKLSSSGPPSASSAKTCEAAPSDSQAVEERASEFHSRQLALMPKSASNKRTPVTFPSAGCRVSMHAFSMLSTNHGKMFQGLAPQALRCKWMDIIGRYS